MVIRMDGSPNNMKDYMKSQMEEIRRHKWIESEKAGRDLGSECVLEWIRRYASQFRDYYTRCHM